MKRVANVADTIPEPCCVLGVWLRPFCLGHHLLFRRLNFSLAENPLAPATPEQWLPALAICAGASFESTLGRMLDGTWESTMAPLWKSARKQRVKLSEAESLFRAYLADGYQDAPVWRRESECGATQDAPWEVALKCALLRAGLSESEILNGYLPARMYEFHALREIDQFAYIERLGLAGVKHPATYYRKVFFTQRDAEKLA